MSARFSRSTCSGANIRPMWIWTALEAGFWFGVTALALIWLASRAYGNDGPRGPVIPALIVAVAAFVAYTMISSPPQQTDCIEHAPQGSGRC